MGSCSIDAPEPTNDAGPDAADAHGDADHRFISTREGSRSGGFGPTEWGLLAATALMWGSAYLLISIGLETLPPSVITFARIALGAATLTAIPAARRTRIERADWPRVVALGVLWLALPLTLFPIAQRSITSAAAGMITGAQPILAAVIATALLRRPPGRRQVQGLLAGFVGVGLVAWSVASPSAGDGSAGVVGVALVLLAVASYALATNLAVPLQQRYGSLPVIWRALLVATVLVAPWGLVSMPGTTPSAASVAAVVPLGVLSTGIGYVAFTSLAGRAGATRGAVAIYFVPVVALLLGAARGEPITALALAGTSLVLVGAWLTSRAER